MKHPALPLLVVAVLCGCTAPADDAETAPRAAPESSQPLTADEARTRINDGVYDAYTKDAYPKLARRLGAAWSRIQPLREAAALHALNSGRCDRVELSEISDRSTSGALSAFVDCTNRERFYVSEADIRGGAQAVAQSDRTITSTSAIEACRAAAQSLTLYPSLANMHTWAGSQFNSNRTTGNAQVILHFEASNAFGTEIPYTARCVFPAGSAIPEITVSDRL